MRLWHYKLIKALPKLQLQGQWRELVAIWESEPNHILINYVYEYPKENFLKYAMMVLAELKARGIRTNSNRLTSYWNQIEMDYSNPFPKHHTKRYLRQCFYNLQEKYDRGQKDFDVNRYMEIERIAK